MKKMNMNAQSDEGERERGGGVTDVNPSLLQTKKNGSDSWLLRGSGRLIDVL